jgi:hypothetical protein
MNGHSKKSHFSIGLFNPRGLLAFALCSVGLLLAMLSFAATPQSRTTGSDANLPGDSVFVDQHAGPLSSKANAVAARIKLAPAAAGSWAIVNSPSTSATQNNYLNGVTCVSASDCWAVGAYSTGSSFQTLILRWDGTSWAIVTSPNTSSTQTNWLNGVTCVSTSDCWAVGYSVSGGKQQTLILRWDGTSWVIVTSPNTSSTQTNYLIGVTCASATDCWAIGDYISSKFRTLIERWNGSSWAIVPSPNTSATQNNFLRAVTCVSASDCRASGYYQSDIAFQTLIERWNGSSWTIVTSPNTLPTQHNYLLGVTCASASECWAVGEETDQIGISWKTLIERWNGTSWTIATSANTSATQNNYLLGATCVPASDCWAVGYYAGMASQTLIERWDGTSWAIVTSPNTSATQSNLLTGVTCVSASDCWAVGYYNNGSSSQTLTEHYTLPPVQLVGVVSRKIHASAGTFDIDLPLAGDPGIECRSGGANSYYTLVFKFANPLSSVGGASVSSGIGSISSSAIDSSDAHNYIVSLTRVTDAQNLTVTLANVNDSAGNSSISVPGPSMGVLTGDVNASGVVTSGDTNLCKAQALQPVTEANFRNDINASGDITTGDVNIIKQNALSQLPTSP